MQMWEGTPSTVRFGFSTAQAEKVMSNSTKPSSVTWGVWVRKRSLRTCSDALQVDCPHQVGRHPCRQQVIHTPLRQRTADVGIDQALVPADVLVPRRPLDALLAEVGHDHGVPLAGLRLCTL